MKEIYTRCSVCDPSKTEQYAKSKLLKVCRSKYKQQV